MAETVIDYPRSASFEEVWAIMSDALRVHILKSGFYAIEQTGDTVQVSVPEKNAVREW